MSQATKVDLKLAGAEKRSRAFHRRSNGEQSLPLGHQRRVPPSSPSVASLDRTTPPHGPEVGAPGLLRKCWTAKPSVIHGDCGFAMAVIAVLKRDCVLQAAPVLALPLALSRSRVRRHEEALWGPTRGREHRGGGVRGKLCPNGRASVHAEHRVI